MNAKFKYLVCGAAVVALAVLAGTFLHLRTADPNRETPGSAPGYPSDTFTFFDLGPRTELTKALRNHLKDLFGKGAVETRTTIDLTMAGIADFSDHFPDLQALHGAFNHLPRQRVEHDTVQLTYHYARRQNIPFDRIRLVFSGQHQVPLFFSLYSRRDGADFIETIEKKHGPPRTIGGENAAARTLYWQKDDTFLIISITRNRIGFNEYNFGIYYLDNLTALAETERLAREAAEKEKEKTGELAF
jgi:hypothetical protein